jgi:pyridoxal phosphate enzyme (YggS family)
MNRYSEVLAGTLPRVRDDFARAAERSGREPSSVRLVAVTKAHPDEVVDAALAAGLTDLGENRVEGLASRLEAGAGRPEWSEVRWHMIGHVQSRKAGMVVELADWVHSVDSLKLARRLSSAAVSADREVPVLVQANTSGEDSKGGFPVEQAVEAVHEVCDLPGLRVEGLMTMAPFVDEERVLRSAFAALREVRDQCRGFTGFGAGELSMGMSNDYPIAIEEGSTMVRLGTVLFGRRPT